MISYLDDVVGRILRFLDEHDLRDDTIVLFSSDNGTTWVGGVDIAFFNSVGELRGHKAQLWEGGLRVPFIARWPGRIAPGSVSDLPCAAYDIVPTLLDLIDAPESPHDASLDGISLAPTLLGDADEQPRHDFLYWEYPEGPQWQAVLLDGRYKAVRSNLRKGDLTIQVFDLEHDPGETTDIAGDHPELVSRAERLMHEQHTPSALFPIKVLDEPSPRAGGSAG